MTKSKKDVGWFLAFWKPRSSANSPVAKEYEKLVAGNKRSEQEFYKLVSAVEKIGPTLALPHNKYVGGGVFELRDRTHGKRYYYAETDLVIEDQSSASKVILLLGAAGDKGSQQRDIERARKRLSENGEENVLNKDGRKILEKEK